MRQMNLPPEVDALANEQLDIVRAGSGQHDVTHSEVVAGFVFALQEAQPHLELSSVGARGAWGSESAKAFPVSLKKQFIRAIGKLYLETYREDGD